MIAPMPTHARALMRDSSRSRFASEHRLAHAAESVLPLFDESLEVPDGLVREIEPQVGRPAGVGALGDARRGSAAWRLSSDAATCRYASRNGIPSTTSRSASSVANTSGAALNAATSRSSRTSSLVNVMPITRTQSPVSRSPSMKGRFVSWKSRL